MQFLMNPHTLRLCIATRANVLVLFVLNVYLVGFDLKNWVRQSSRVRNFLGSAELELEPTLGSRTRTRTRIRTVRKALAQNIAQFNLKCLQCEV